MPGGAGGAGSIGGAVGRRWEAIERWLCFFVLGAAAVVDLQDSEDANHGPLCAGKREAAHSKAKKNSNFFKCVYHFAASSTIIFERYRTGIGSRPRVKHFNNRPAN